MVYSDRQGRNKGPVVPDASLATEYNSTTNFLPIADEGIIKWCSDITWGICIVGQNNVRNLVPPGTWVLGRGPICCYGNPLLRPCGCRAGRTDSSLKPGSTRLAGVPVSVAVGTGPHCPDGTPLLGTCGCRAAPTHSSMKPGSTRLAGVPVSVAVGTGPHCPDGTPLLGTCGCRAAPTHSSMKPGSTRLAGVPVSVAVPPMLAA